MDIQFDRMLIKIIDPSYPMKNGRSPFMEASNDVLNLIFRKLSAEGVKEKMKHELLCSRFSSRMKKREAWTEVNELQLGQYEQYMLINAYQFSFETAPIALSQLFQRIQVEKLTMYELGVLANFRLTLCHVISLNQKYFNLQSMQFLTTSDYDGTVMCAIAGCGLTNVRRIEFGDWENKRHVNNLPFAFYSMISQCHNLDTIVLRTNEISLILDQLIPALANCNLITKLLLADDQDAVNMKSARDFGALCSSSLPKLRTLWFQPVITFFVPMEYIMAIDQQLRFNIESFGITLDSRTYGHRLLLAGICKYFPNLKTLNIKNIGGRFLTQVILALIGNIFHTFGNRDVNIYHFTLNVGVRNAGTVLLRLAQKKWHENEELAKIEASNGTWSCIKDNVAIRLNFSNLNV